MNRTRNHLSDQEIRAIEEDLQCSLDMLESLPDDEQIPAAVLRASVELSVSLFDALCRERLDRRASETSNPSIEVESLRTFIGVLMRIASISESHWLEMAHSDAWLHDRKYRHQLMNRLGNSLREFRVLMNENGEVVKNKLITIEKTNLGIGAQNGGSPVRSPSGE